MQRQARHKMELVEGIKNTSNAVAHDLRTPLAELRARLEELLRTHPPPATTFAEIHQSGHRLVHGDSVAMSFTSGSLDFVCQYAFCRRC
jgi:signal transduction histidine kinase